MNRRSFFKFLGIGAATAAVAPKVLADIKPLKVKYTVDEWKWEPLVTWEEPRTRADYSIGVYTGYGLQDSAPTCISVMRKGEGEEPDVQVAEFVSRKVNPGQVAPIVAYISRLFGKKCKDARGPMIVIEQITAPGDVVQYQLKVMGFTRFFSTETKAEKAKDGWYSTKVSTPLLMERFSAAIDNGWYKPRSRNIKNIGQEQCFMAAAQSYIGAHNETTMEIDSLLKNGWWTNRISPKLEKQRLESLLPDEVKISDEDYKWLKSLEESAINQLETNDMKLLLRKRIQRVKRNA